MTCWGKVKGATATKDLFVPDAVLAVLQSYIKVRNLVMP